MCGSSQPTTTVQQYQPPAQVLQNYGALTAAGQNLIQQPQQQYGGDLVAGFNPDQNQAFQTVQNAQGIAQPYINAGAQEIGASTAPLWNGPVTSSGIASYESPYTSAVTNSMQDLYNQENKQAVENVAGNATTHGAYGGDREAIAEGITQGQMQLGENQNLAQVQQQGYNTALGEANTQQQTELGANEANRYLDSQAGYGLGNLGNEAQSTALSGASAQLQTGADQQALEQEQLNVPYEEFQAQQAYPYQQLQFMAGLDASAAGAVGGTSTGTSPGASPLSQVIGGGLAGYSLANSIGGGGILGSNTAGGFLGSNPSAALTSLNSYDPAAVGPGYNGIPLGFAGGGRVHRDMGGASPALNPVNQSLMSQMATIPDDKLREMAARVPPNTPQGQAIQRVMQQRQVHPNQQGIAGASSGIASGQAPGIAGAPTAPSAPQVSQPMGSMKWGGRTRLASGGTGGAAGATTFVVGGNGIGIPQVGNSIFAGPAAGASSSYGLAGAGPGTSLPQIANSKPNITTAVSPAITGGIANPQNYKAPDPSSLVSGGNSGIDAGIGGLLGLGLAFLKDGGRAHYDDGGGVDDDDDMMDETPLAEDDDDTAPTPVSAPATGIAAAAPPPQQGGRPTASAAPPPSASSVTKEPHQFTPDKNEILLKAGLAMMAGNSPNAAANIGRGGLAGVQEYDQQKQWDAQQQMRQAALDRETQRDAITAQHFKDVDDKPIIDHSGPTTRIMYPSEKDANGNPKMIDLGIPTTDSVKAQAQTDHYKAMEGIASKRLDIMQQGVDAENSQYLGQSADPDHPGAITMDKKTHQISIQPIQVAPKQAAPGSGGSVSQWKYNAWLQTHPDDTQGALDFVAGHKQLGPSDALKFGYGEAAKEAAAGYLSGKDDVDARAKAIAGQMSSAGPTAPGQRPTASAQPPEQTPMPAVPLPADRKVGQSYPTPKGNLTWTGTGWLAPQPPAN